ncbi:unnamed protein product [Closterium sp. NIES-53]
MSVHAACTGVAAVLPVPGVVVPRPHLVSPPLPLSLPFPSPCQFMQHALASPPFSLYQVWWMSLAPTFTLPRSLPVSPKRSFLSLPLPVFPVPVHAACIGITAILPVLGVVVPRPPFTLPLSPPLPPPLPLILSLPPVSSCSMHWRRRRSPCTGCGGPSPLLLHNLLSSFLSLSPPLPMSVRAACAGIAAILPVPGVVVPRPYQVCQHSHAAQTLSAAPPPLRLLLPRCDFPRRTEWDERIRRFLTSDAMRSKPFIWLGDLNSNDDVSDPEFFRTVTNGEPATDPRDQGQPGFSVNERMRFAETLKRYVCVCDRGSVPGGAGQEEAGRERVRKGVEGGVSV